MDLSDVFNNLDIHDNINKKNYNIKREFIINQIIKLSIKYKIQIIMKDIENLDLLLLINYKKYIQNIINK